MAAGLNSAALHVGGAAIATAIQAIAIHTATPDASGSNASAAARVAVTPSDTAGVITIGSTNFTGGAASGPAIAVGYWSQVATGGTFYGYNLLTGDQTFNAAGAYTVDSVTITGTAS